MTIDAVFYFQRRMVMRTFWRSLSRGWKIAVVLLLVSVMSVAAWSAWYAFQAASTFNIGFQDPPSEINVTMNGVCNHESGAGQVNGGVAVLSGNDLSCTWSGLNETSVISMQIYADNALSGVVVDLDIDAVDPTPCFTVTDNGPVSIIAGATGSINIRYTGNAETYTCAGAPGVFTNTYSVTPQ